MSIFGCASDEQFKLELQDFKSLKLNKKDFKRLFYIQAVKMEKYLKDKGFYDDFYNTCVLPELKVDTSLLAVSAFTGELQVHMSRENKSYNEMIQEHFNADVKK